MCGCLPISVFSLTRVGFSRMQYVYIGLGVAGVVLVLFLIFLTYRRVYLPGQRRREYERLRDDNDKKTAAAGQPSV